MNLTELFKSKTKSGLRCSTCRYGLDGQVSTNIWPCSISLINIKHVNSKFLLSYAPRYNVITSITIPNTSYFVFISQEQRVNPVVIIMWP